MFNIGDKIVYPMYGAGVIESVEEKEVLGEKKKYYIMRIPVGDMKVMIPIDSMTEFGVRRITDYSSLEEVMEVLKGKGREVPYEWNKRYRYNIDKMRKGSIYAIAEVVKDLSVREGRKSLSPGEKKILDNAKQIFFSELMLITGAEYEDVEKMVNDAISKSS